MEIKTGKHDTLIITIIIIIVAVFYLFLYFQTGQPLKLHCQDCVGLRAGQVMFRFALQVNEFFGQDFSQSRRLS